ncbi:MAG TPA: hypothetical protein VN027_16460 [Isoptericola sp.]|nr:hypothetical protein [Isoptericola sp.]
MLRRQVHPSMLDPVVGFSSAVFMPEDPDDGTISTLRGHVEPDEAYRRHVASDLKSVGTWGLSVGEALGHGLPSWDDGLINGNPQDHASVDFAEFPAKTRRHKIAKKLRDVAVTRGCLYSPEP